MIISLSSVPHTKTVRHLGKGSHWSLATPGKPLFCRNTRILPSQIPVVWLYKLLSLTAFWFYILDDCGKVYQKQVSIGYKKSPSVISRYTQTCFFFTSLAVSTLALYNQFLRTSCMTLPPHIAFEKSVIKRPDSSALKFTGECATRLRSTVRTLFLRIYIHWTST